MRKRKLFEIRKKSNLELVREINNRYKRDLLQKCELEGKSVMDKGFGNLGDLQKHLHEKTKLYFGIDQDLEMWQKAQQRLHEFRQASIQKHQRDPKVLHPDHWMTQFYLAAPVRMENPQEIEQAIRKQIHQQDMKFDVIVAFFSLHTIFKNESTLNGLCSSIDRFLKQDGQFVCTFMDGACILDWMKAEKGGGTQVSGEDFKIQLESKTDLISDQVTLGMPVSVQINAQTVPLHTEYLTSLPLLEKYLQVYHIYLVETELFKIKPEELIQFDKGSSEKKLVECSRSAIFKRRGSRETDL